MAPAPGRSMLCAMSRPSAQPRPVRRAIVAADRRIRSGLTSLFAASGDATIVGAAGNLDGAIEPIAAQRPDVVVLDPRFPDVATGQVLPDLRRRFGSARFLVITWSGSNDAALLDLGADALVDASSQPSTFLDAVSMLTTASPGSDD